MADSQDNLRSPNFGEGLLSDGGPLSRWAENPIFLRLTQNKWFRKLPPWVWGAFALGVLFAITWVLNNRLTLVGASPAAPAGENTTQLAVDILIKLSLIVGLIYGGLWAFRRWRGAEIRKGVKKIDVLETIHLSPRRALHVIQAGDRQLLIGATDQNVTYLSEIESAPAQPVEETFPAFADVLTGKTHNSAIQTNGAAIQTNGGAIQTNGGAEFCFPWV